MLLEELDLVDQSEEFLMGLIGIDPEVRVRVRVRARARARARARVSAATRDCCALTATGYH